MVSTRTSDPKRDIQRGTRRKRRASSIGSLNDGVESETVSQGIAAKPRKRRARRTDTQQLDQELEDAATRSEEAEAEAEAEANTEEPEQTNSVVVSDEDEESEQEEEEVSMDHSKHVHFSDPAEPIAGIRSSPPVPVTRASLSPAGRLQPTKPYKSSRHSLPARLPGTPERLVDHVQFQSLKQALSERSQRRLKRNHLSEEMNSIEEHDKADARMSQELKRLHKEIEEKNKMLVDLNWEVEDSRLRGISLGEEDDKIKSLEAELAKMTDELTARNNGVVYRGSPEDGDTDMDDDPTFINPEEINISPEDMTPSHSFTRVLTQVKPSSFSPVPDQSREVEIQKFEKAIHRLTQEAAEAKYASLTMTLELQSLGFAGSDEPGLVVCAAIRQAMEQARMEAEELIPEQSPGTHHGADFLKLLTQTIRRLLQSADDDLQTIRHDEEMQALLVAQHNGLLDKLSQTTIRKDTLEKHWKAMDRQLDTKAKQMVQLEEAKSSLTAVVHKQEDDLGQKEGRIGELESDVSQQLLAVQRLKDALESYRTDLANVQALVARMEKEHASKVAQIESDAIRDIDAYKDELAQEKTNRQIAENEIDEKTTQITNLQISIESAKTELDELKQQLEKSKAHANDETTLREETEAELAQRNDFIEELEGKVDRYEVNLGEFGDNVKHLSELLDTERRQREAAETDLETRVISIADLDSRLRDEGVRSNELRMKLFQEQQERAKEIKDLATAAAKREDHLSKTRDIETSRREAAESKIELLEDKIKQLDQAMAELNNVKDELLRKREAAINSLQADLATTNEELNALANKSESDIQSLHENVASLTETLAQRTHFITDLEGKNREISRARQTENEKKDGQIADLEDDLSMARSNIGKLEAAKSSLEARVENEAKHLLEVQNEAADKVEKLQDRVRDSVQENKKLRQAAVDMQQKHDVEIEAKVAELASLRTVNTAAADKTKELKKQVALLQQKLRQRIKEEGDAIPAMLHPFREAIAQAYLLGDGLVDSGESLLKEIENMEEIETNGDAVPITTGETAKVSKSTARVRKGAKKPRDSGLGLVNGAMEA